MITRERFSDLREFLGHEVGGGLAGAGLFVVALVLFLFGVAMLVRAYDKAGAPTFPRWHPRRWIAPTLDWYLGLLIIELDVIVYGYLSYTMIREGITVPFWFAVLASLGGVLAIKALQHFAQDRVGEAKRT